MTHVSERLNNQNVSYNKFTMCSNKTVLPHAWGKTAPSLFTLILGFKKNINLIKFKAFNV